jgi:hypothetical protein
MQEALPHMAFSHAIHVPPNKYGPGPVHLVYTNLIISSPDKKWTALQHYRRAASIKRLAVPEREGYRWIVNFQAMWK